MSNEILPYYPPRLATGNIGSQVEPPQKSQGNEEIQRTPKTTTHVEATEESVNDFSKMMGPVKLVLMDGVNSESDFKSKLRAHLETPQMLAAIHQLGLKDSDVAEFIDDICKGMQTINFDVNRFGEIYDEDAVARLTRGRFGSGDVKTVAEAAADKALAVKLRNTLNETIETLKNSIDENKPSVPRPSSQRLRLSSRETEALNQSVERFKKTTEAIMKMISNIGIARIEKRLEEQNLKELRIQFPSEIT